MYDRHHAEQCGAVRLGAEPCAAEGETAEGSAVGGSTAVVPTKVVTELEDGQAQVRSTQVGKVVCQIDDGECRVTFCSSSRLTFFFWAGADSNPGQVQGHTAACVNSTQPTGTGISPTGTAHNHTSPATTSAEPSPTEDEEDDSGAGALAIHGLAASAVAVGYFVVAALY